MNRFALLSVFFISAAPAQDKSLYDRLGGVKTLAVIVDEIVDVTYKNEVIMSNPKVKEAFAKTPAALQKFQVTLFLCELTGGPYKYSGKAIPDAHKGLGITEEQFGALGGQLKELMNKHKVPEKEQQELIDAVGKYKGSVVESSEPKK